MRVCRRGHHFDAVSRGLGYGEGGGCEPEEEWGGVEGWGLEKGGGCEREEEWGGVEGLGLEKPVVMELCEAVEGNRWEGCQLTVP